MIHSRGITMNLDKLTISELIELLHEVANELESRAMQLSS